MQDPYNVLMRPNISDDVLDRLKKYCSSKDRKLSGKGNTGWHDWTLDDALSVLLKEAGF